MMKGSGYEINWKGITLYRIRALKSFGFTSKGSLGGFIQKEDNLSQKGYCWIEDQAKVYGSGYVKDDAIIWDKAEIYDHASVANNAKVEDNSKVYGNAIIDKNVRVGGEAEIYHHTWITDNSIILDNCKIFHKSVISGDSVLRDNTIICGHSVIDSCRFSGDSFIENEHLENAHFISYKDNLYNDYKNNLVKTKLKINNIPSTPDNNDPTKDPDFVNKVW